MKMWLIDRKQAIQWITAAVARGIAGALAGWLGLSAAKSEDLGTTAAEALGALVMVIISIYTSYKGRKMLSSAPKAPSSWTSPPKEK